MAFMEKLLVGLIQALGTETEQCWWDGQVLWVITEDMRNTEDARGSFVNAGCWHSRWNALFVSDHV